MVGYLQSVEGCSNDRLKIREFGNLKRLEKNFKFKASENFLIQFPNFERKYWAV